MWFKSPRASQAKASRIRGIVSRVAVFGTALGLFSWIGPTTAGAAGPPIKVMVLASLSGPIVNFPDMVTGVNAELGAYNKAGGVHGTKVDVTFCDDQDNPNTAGACARQAVSNGDVAVLGIYSLYSNVSLPILQAAGIPYVGNRNETAADMESPISFPVAGPVGQVSSAVLLADHGCKKAGIIVDSVAAGILHGNEYALGFQLKNIPVAPMIGVSASTVDFSAAVATLESEGVQCVTASMTLPQFPPLITAIRQSGKNMMMGFLQGALTTTNYQQMGSTLNGIYLSGQGLTPQDTKQPAVKEFYTDVKKYAPNHPVLEQFGMVAFGAAQMLFQAMNTIKGDVTPSSVTAAMSKVITPATSVLGPVNMTKPNTYPGMQRSFSNTFFSWQIKKGQPVLLSPKPIDLSSAIPPLSKLLGG
jgi:ABC-type branched-subunit amino acid transport system substrate-binding protein